MDPIYCTLLTTLCAGLCSQIASADNSFSTRLPAVGQDYRDEGSEEYVDPGLGGADIVITALQLEPFLVEREGEESLLEGEYGGVLPELLGALCYKGYVPCDYSLVLAKDNTVGTRHMDGSWDGMIGELQLGHTDIGVGPVLRTSTREEVVQFSKPWMEVSLVVLVNQYSNVNNLQELVKANMTYGMLTSDDDISDVLRSQHGAPYSQLWGQLQSSPDHSVKEQDAIARLRDNLHFGLITSSATAKNILRTECSLKSIGTDLNLGGFGFAFKKNDLRFVDKVNEGLLKLHEDGSLHELLVKNFAVTCGANAITPTAGLLMILLQICVTKIL